MTGRGKYNDIVWESPHTVGQWAHFSLEALHSDFIRHRCTHVLAIYLTLFNTQLLYFNAMIGR